MREKCAGDCGQKQIKGKGIFAAGKWYCEPCNQTRLDKDRIKVAPGLLGVTPKAAPWRRQGLTGRWG